MISIIAAIARNRAIGADNSLLWHLPGDMKRFRELTAGHTVIMGRRTFESLPNGALPNRTNVVITRKTGISFDKCEVFNDLEAAIERHKHEDEVFIIGGASIYSQALELADKLYITLVRHDFENADVYFPEIDDSKWIMTASEEFQSDEKNLYPYTFRIFIKKK
ncbi:MAG: dihydrofolate reductase [Tannerella sp.]|jgi:dihydrofolate reductase|nr:dihydrofolate reductase [Tannerella sp.]